MPEAPDRPALHWDLFCRVIDNHGDLGVDLRLARDLARRGDTVRLWCDDLRALAWMQPWPEPRLHALPWDQSLAAEPADVVVETFGCELPEPYVERMAGMAAPAGPGRAPVWINLEYLSAEPYVERSHGLRSPQMSGPGRGLDKWFFYPGFTERTGGLLREPGLLDDAAAHDGPAWLAERGWAPRTAGHGPGDGGQAPEQVLSLFAYPNAPLADLLAALPGPWLLLLCPGEAQARAQALVRTLGRTDLRCITLPYLPQPDYDRLLWSCTLNLVRGEDSFVRAQWAGHPLLWQIYFQDDYAHAPKLDAFLDASGASANWRALSRAWNGLQPWSDAARQALAELPQVQGQALAWRAKLGRQADLTTQLRALVWQRLGETG